LVVQCSLSVYGPLWEVNVSTAQATASTRLGSNPHPIDKDYRDDFQRGFALVQHWDDSGEGRVTEASPPRWGSFLSCHIGGSND
jgi:hypothetical protein